jgi:hypothetical protein
VSGNPHKINEMTAREKRGLEMAGSIGRRNEPDVSIQRMNKLTYKVKSQSEAGKWYTVIKQYGRTFGDNARDGQWTCDCPDSTFRHFTCKHVQPEHHKCQQARTGRLSEMRQL